MTKIDAQREANLTLTAAGYATPLPIAGLKDRLKEQTQGGSLLRLGREQSVPDEDAAKARKLVASVIGQKLSELETTEIDEFVRDTDYLPKDSPFTLAERILHRLITDRIAAMASEDVGRIAESGASPSAGTVSSGKLRAIDERLTSVEGWLSNREIEQELQASRTRRETAEREARKTLMAAGLV